MPEVRNVSSNQEYANAVVKCESCETIRECKHAFGKFWSVKSNDGEGCEHPFRPPEGWLTEAEKTKVRTSAAQAVQKEIIATAKPQKMTPISHNKVFDKLNRLKQMGL